MQEQKTLNLLNFSTNEFNTHCQELLKEMVEKNIKNCFADIEEKLISERNNNISKAICGKDLYDYSELEDVYYVLKDEKNRDELVNISTENGYYRLIEKFKSFQHNNNNNQKIKYIKSNCIYTSSNHDLKPEEKVQEFFCEKHHNLKKGEKVIFLWKNYKNSGSSNCDNFVCNSFGNKYIEKLIIITNFSRVFFMDENFKFALYDFWLPVDYILILRSVILLNYKEYKKNGSIYNTPYKDLSPEELNLKFPNYGTQIDPNTIFSTLEMMKSTLYNRKFIPLYVKDVIQENETLKEKMKEYDQFNKDKEEFLKENKPYLDLIEDKKNLDLLREELRIEKEKLRLVSIKLKHDKLDFNEKLEKFQNLDIDDFLK